MHTRSHTCTHMHIRSHTCTHVHTHAHTYTHMDVECTRTWLSPTPPFWKGVALSFLQDSRPLGDKSASHKQRYPRTNTHTHTNARTHTYTHSSAHRLFCRLNCSSRALTWEMFCSHTRTARLLVMGSVRGHISNSTHRNLPGWRLLQRSCGNLDRYMKGVCMSLCS